MIYRDATEDDFVRFYSAISNRPWFGKVIMRRSVIVAIGGIYQDNKSNWIAFLDVPGRVRRLSLFRVVRRFLLKMHENDVGPILAYRDVNIPRSDVFLSRLGFTQTGDVNEDNQEVWLWHKWH